MRLGRLATAIVLGTAMLLAGGAAAAQSYPGIQASRTAIFWRPAEIIYGTGLQPELCARGTYKASYAAGAPKFRMAVRERHGELIGEIRAPQDRAPRAIAQARSCALEAGAAATPNGLLNQNIRGWTTFRAAFAGCMLRNHAQDDVGSMTLWIDEHCNW